MTGSDNTAVGEYALTNSTGLNNVAIGANAGTLLTSGNDNVYVAHPGAASESATIRIGGSAQSRAFIAGIRGVTTGTANAVAVLIDSNGQLGTASSSRRFKFDINDMSGATDGLMRLRPVTFRYIAHGENAAQQYGLIAEEVAGVYPELVTRDKDGQVETVMYQFLAPMLLNEVQKQRRTIEEQQQENEALRARLDRLERAVAKMSVEK